MKSILSFLLIMNILLVSSQDFDGPRRSGSATDGINITPYYNTNIQLTSHTHSASHGILFNSYKSNSTVSGGLGATGNTRFANGEGSYEGGAGAILFYGNGGNMDFLISPISSGTDNAIDWSGTKMRIQRNGRVGIGTNSPIAQFHVRTNSIGLGHDDDFAENSILEASDSGLGIYSSDGGSFGSRLVLGEVSSETLTNKWGLIRSTGTQSKFFLTYGTEVDVATNAKFFTVRHNGNVGIGTTNPDSKLTVKGNIHAEEVKVDLSVPGPDYVFEEDYNLRSLEETEAYIKENKHLPEIPSAKEMEANGLELGEMNMLLLKKIEELTLYVIELKKENESQQQEIEILKKDK